MEPFIWLGMILVLVLFLFSDEIASIWPKGMLCKLGLHKRKFKKTKKYYCRNCGKPRDYPKLELIKGSNKIKDNTYKF